MFDDFDVKIAGDKPSESVKKNENKSDERLNTDTISSAKALGTEIAKVFCGSVNTAFADDTTDSQMLIQRQYLLSFTVSVILDEYCINDSVSGIAEKSFLDYLKANDPDLYSTKSEAKRS